MNEELKAKRDEWFSEELIKSGRCCESCSQHFINSETNILRAWNAGYEVMLKEEEELKKEVQIKQIQIKQIADQLSSSSSTSNPLCNGYFGSDQHLYSDYGLAEANMIYDVTKDMMGSLVAENEKLKSAADGLVEALEHLKAAMTSAYEDRVDQYYLNTIEAIERALEVYREQRGKAND